MPAFGCLFWTAQRFIIAALFILLPGCSYGEQPGPLAVKKEKWTQKVFPEKNMSVGRSEAASFLIDKDTRYGPTLAIGPWLAGTWNAYFQYTGLFSLSRGTIRGLYRTVDLKPFEACVFVTYYKMGIRIDTHSFSLPPAREWTPFEVVVRHPPPGTESISPGFGLRQKTEGRVLFTNISVSAEAPAAAFPDDLPPVTRHVPSEDFGKGDFFRIEQDSRKAWWLVTPEGRPFYSIGTVGPGFERDDRGYGKGRMYSAQVRDMGFNSLGGWTGLQSWAGLNRLLEKEGKAAIPLFYAIESNKLKGGFDFLTDPNGKTCGGSGHEFPDPFDPGYRDAYNRHVEEVAQLISGEKWFIGWFADNERDHADLYRCIGSPYAKGAFMSWLKQRYGSLKALNTAWSTSFTSMDEVALSLPIPPRKGRIYNDLREFAGVIVSQFAAVTLHAIRAADPSHLVFSPRFMISDSSDWFSLLEHYKSFDAVAVNIYPSNRVPGLTDNEKLFLRMVHERSGKPLIISEWSVPALDSGLYAGPDNLDWSYSKVVSTQKERARQAALATIDFFNETYIIGAHWFIWKDFDSGQRKANRGLFRADGQSWTELQEKLRKAHGMIK